MTARRSASDQVLAFAHHPLRLRNRGVALVLAAAAGASAAAGSAVLGAYLFGMPMDIVRSIAPKSVTAPVAMGIAERIGGVPALAAVFAVITVVVGALSA